MSQIKIAGIKAESIVDGPGIRYVVFTQGCPHKCPGCHNPKTHDPDQGRLMDSRELIEDIKSNPLLDGVSLSGGEPFLQAHELLGFIRQVKELGLNIITYTGYRFEDILRDTYKKPDMMELLSLSDYLIDGRFVLEQKDLLLEFRGSRNQRIIDIKKSLARGRVVETSFTNKII